MTSKKALTPVAQRPLPDAVKTALAAYETEMGVAAKYLKSILSEGSLTAAELAQAPALEGKALGLADAGTVLSTPVQPVDPEETPPHVASAIAAVLQGKTLLDALTDTDKKDLSCEQKAAIKKMLDDAQDLSDSIGTAVGRKGGGV